MEASISDRLLQESERWFRQTERRCEKRQFTQDLRSYTCAREPSTHSYPASTIGEEVGSKIQKFCESLFRHTMNSMRITLISVTSWHKVCALLTHNMESNGFNPL